MGFVWLICRTVFPARLKAVVHLVPSGTAIWFLLGKMDGPGSRLVRLRAEQIHRVDSLFQAVPHLWIDTTAGSLSCFLFLIPFPLPVSINMTSGAALYKLFCHRGNICSLNAPAELSLGGIALRFMRNLSFKPSEGLGREGMLGLTLVLCCFSGILRKNVVSDFVDCQNEARWQWIKCNAALLFLVRDCASPWAREPFPCSSPRPMCPSHRAPLPVGSQKCFPGGGERRSFIWWGLLIGNRLLDIFHA